MKNKSKKVKKPMNQFCLDCWGEAVLEHPHMTKKEYIQATKERQKMVLNFRLDLHSMIDEAVNAAFGENSAKMHAFVYQTVLKILLGLSEIVEQLLCSYSTKRN
jgi:hypothetical protein